MNALDYVEKQQLRTDIPEFRPGDTIKVHVKIKEGDKERVQVFEGICIAQKHGGARETFTVRKMSFGHGVERIFPLHSPRYEKIEVLTRGDVNRNRLFYLRGLRGKASRVDVQEELQEVAAAAPGSAPAAGGTAEKVPAEPKPAKVKAPKKAKAAPAA